MGGDEHGGMLLGKNTPVVDAYAPQLLFPIPRARGRHALGVTGVLPFHGIDVWHAYELSWLDPAGRPLARVGRLCVPASSPNMVESKSLKLYFNSLNNTCFASEAVLVRTVCADISAVAGAPVELELLDVCDPRLAGSAPPGDCLDDLEFAPVAGEPRADLLETGEQYAEQTFYSHLLRSLCPVTGQPDWATVWLCYGGPAIRPESLLRYIIAYRCHQEFHEQCIERMFCDIQASCRPRFLHIQGCYTRRGGLDISPFRSTDPQAAPLPRLNRQ
ncbi:MAG: NADPH-dependent 7-cyano-7-deazaguanine reductase QueF [Pseudomonadales bacterium]|nr:NADPH-dependent 7-cyano-7-deazaguanine reductase QueF [Pseudomonadales bacterium]MCP5203255.1 NADPH-dependent 7-cyano-7-deazaguanine reductase QueF [Pseudomonadales bacterium]